MDDVPFSIPAASGVQDLSNVINKLLEAKDGDFTHLTGPFLITSIFEKMTLS